MKKRLTFFPVCAIIITERKRKGNLKMAKDYLEIMGDALEEFERWLEEQE